ncbi:MAG: hypothetical protein EXR72_21700 [Myxococcales bacterium]|nr:hypothetical protein [Myxococcales bacterium]
MLAVVGALAAPCPARASGFDVVGFGLAAVTLPVASAAAWGFGFFVYRVSHHESAPRFVAKAEIGFAAPPLALSALAVGITARDKNFLRTGGDVFLGAAVVLTLLSAPVLIDGIVALAGSARRPTDRTITVIPALLAGPCSLGGGLSATSAF